jgi:deoxyribonuclease-4
MMEAVVCIADQASKRCPLLLETPAGEKGELCSSRNDLIGFFSALPERVKSRVGLCVDTCHVFSAGYLPDEYIQGLDRTGIQIKLFHYNDSYYDRNCRRDCHAPVGEGYVGLSSMQAVLVYAMQNKIPCVTE